VREHRMIDIPFTHVVPNMGSGQVVLSLAQRFKALAIRDLR